VFENVGGGEVLLIVLVILIFFGPKKIPELAQSLGKGMRKFNDAKQGFESQVKTAMKEPLAELTKTKQDLEAQLRSVAEPLHAELKLPTSQTQPTAPTLPQVPETMPRGAAIQTDTADQADQTIPSREA
jgi:sec-independent protein translocase protein TatA